MSEQRASVSPVALLLQVPRDAMSPHDLQIPVHAVWQQKPCSQNPDRHSWGPKHAAPGGLRPQVPLVQTAGALQSVSAVHDGLHAFPPHWYGKQSVAGRRDAGAGAVAGRKRGEQVAHRRTGGLEARRPGGVTLAGARLAAAVGAAARGALIRAARFRIDRAGGDVRADAHHARDAGLARPGAVLIAAHALRAESALALVRDRARRAVVLQTAGVVDAGVGRHTLLIGGARVEALVDVAGERRAGQGVGRHALPVRVAHRRGRVDVRRARLVGADGVHRVLLAAAAAVALAVEAAGRRRLDRAHRARIRVAAGGHHAAPGRRRQRAAAAGAGAGVFAADVVDAEAGDTFAPGFARPVRFASGRTCG